MFKLYHKSILLAALFFVACSSSNKTEQTAEEEEHDPSMVEFTPEQYKLAGIQVGNVLSINLSDFIKVSGTIDVPAQQTVSISSPYGGTVKSTSVIEGKYYRKGQVVATLENPEFIQVQQDYLEGKSQLAFLTQDLRRQEQLVKENIAAAKSLQRARSEYNTMLARVEGLKSQLRLIGISPGSVRPGNITSRVNVYSPIGGYVTNVYSNTGKYVTANEVLADMVNTNNILLKVKVFEKDLPKVRIGQTIRFSSTGESSQRNAQIMLIGKDIDKDRTVEVHAKITGSSNNLIPGMFVNGIIELGAKTNPAVPEDAVVQAGGKNYIFILEEEAEKKAKPAAEKEEKAEASKEEEEAHIAFRQVEVGAGVTENGYTAIILPEDFDPKSKIVFKGAYDILSKMNNAEEEGGHH